MNRRSEKGIALVITLIMLSVVTFMAIVFLAVTRRERGAVSMASDRTGAQLMAEAALARAQAQAVSQMMASTNVFDYNFFVSTNYYQSAGFKKQRNTTPDPTNVSYTYPSGSVVVGADLFQNIANLQYDPRPPVFVTRSDINTNSDFRFYLDFNRNGRFETNGLQPIIAANGNFVATNGTTTTSLRAGVLSNYYVGDPEWIGVLERPDRPHSETNRFVGRYAFLALPAGKSLDLNFIHNHASRVASDAMLTPGDNGFYRNQGVGSWELNLAGFLRDLNNNSYAWPATTYRGYNPLGSASLKPSGFAFDDARGLLAYRYGNFRTSLKPMNQTFKTTFNFARDLIDQYSDGPIDAFNRPMLQDNDLVRTSWPGSESTNALVDVQDLFTLGRLTNVFGFSSRLRSTMTPDKLSSYDRYTFYRLLGQMGVDSAPALKTKININYEVERGKTSTNINHWVPSHFFVTAADAMLKACIFTNWFQVGNRLFTNYYIGDTVVRPDISVTNIQVYFGPTAPRTNGYGNTNTEYTASIHRILQVAANIYDATTNAGNAYPYLPSVFRPVFTKTPTNIVISGFVEEVNANFVRPGGGTAWLTMDQFAAQPANTYSNLMVQGQPLVIGAKKGYPNFNEFTIQTAIQVSRKLELLKASASAQFPIRTNEMYLLGITNLTGIEAWNSYTQAFKRSFEIRATNFSSLVLSNIYRPANGPPSTNRIRAHFDTFVANLSTNSWPGETNMTGLTTNSAAFKIPIYTNVVLLTNLAYIPSYFGTFNSWFAPNTVSNLFEPNFDPPEWQLYITNSLTYIMIDSTSQRVVDYVSLDSLTNVVNISQLLAGSTNMAQEIITGAGVNPGAFWDTNRVNGLPNGVTRGILAQIAVSLGDIPVSRSFWNSFNGARPAGLDKDNSIALFKQFMGQGGSGSRTERLATPPSYSHQAPFTPTRRIYKKFSWQANDPLVHYMVADLTDPFLNDPSKTNNVAYLTPNTALPPSNLGMRNERFRPWGGSPGKDTLNDASAYDLALKDPLVYKSDDWAFPENPLATNVVKFANIGWLGRVHRGTPWQTIYLKSAMTAPTNWVRWSGSYGTDPTNDWKFLDLFTTALNDNAARGLLSVNQTNMAAWSAVLSGVAVLSNSYPNAALGPNSRLPVRYEDMFVEPASPQLAQIVAGINSTRAQQTNYYVPNGVFTNLGSILATPELSTRSPFLNTGDTNQARTAIGELAYERLPQQILSLIKEDEPRLVIYAFGQALKPAPRSLITDASYYGLCTNYQITGESVTKTVLRFEGEVNNPKNPLRTVVESHIVLPPD